MNEYEKYLETLDPEDMYDFSDEEKRIDKKHPAEYTVITRRTTGEQYIQRISDGKIVWMNNAARRIGGANV